MGRRRLVLVLVLLWTSLLCIMISTPTTKDGFPLGALAAESPDDNHDLPELALDSETENDDDDDTGHGGIITSSSNIYVLLNPNDPIPDDLPPATTDPGVNAGLECLNPDYSGPCDNQVMTPERCDDECQEDLSYHHGYCGYIKVLKDINPAWSWACICC